MLRQAENRVKVEGILNEIELKYGSFKKMGVDTETIGGSISVKVKQKINGEEKELVIPVYMFSTKFTNAGRPNPAYESIERVMNEFHSIAAVGEENADCIRITGGDIRMNEFYSRDGRFVSYPRVHASFVNKIARGDMHPEASFSAEFVIAKKVDEVNSNGEETGRLRVDAILPQYGGKVDVVPLYAESENVISSVSTYWEVGDTVKAHGRLDFSSITETTLEEAGFGEPIERVRTINRSDIVITGGSQEPLSGDFAYDADEIQSALADRKMRLEQQKDKPKAEMIRKAPARNGFNDLGF